MKHQEFNDWLHHMNLSERRAAEVLGCAPATVGNLRRGHSPIDRRTALACAALAAGIEPWGDEKPQDQVGNKKTP